MGDLVERLRALEEWIRHPTGEPFNMNTDMFDDAADEIESLRAEVEKLKRRVEWFTHAVHTCHDECDRPLCKTTRERDALRASNARLVEALEPFVTEAEHWESCEDDEPLVEAYPGYEGNLTIGDLRRAKAALAGAEGGEQ